MKELLLVEHSLPLSGEVEVPGAKNAVLVTLASLLLAPGKSVLRKVPASEDVLNILELLRQLGADVCFNIPEQTVTVDATHITTVTVNLDIVRKMRASVLVAGSLIGRFGHARVAVPGGCSIGSRPIDFHLKAFKKMGLIIEEDGEFVSIKGVPKPTTIVLEYPSVGATENIMMAALAAPGSTTIINAAIEPEVIDLITVLTKMGAHIEVHAPATIVIHGGATLCAITHDVVPDRLEAGALLLAAAVTGGSVLVKNAVPAHMDVFLDKLEEMGHLLVYDRTVPGIYLKATLEPQAVSFKTGPFPGFPTDLQSPMMAAQCLAHGESVIAETVFENRLLHVPELIKMGAHITVDGTTARVKGVKKLVGTHVQATDIRASCALALAGLTAQGQTIIEGTHHWKRGYEKLEEKLVHLGASIRLATMPLPTDISSSTQIMF